MFPLLSLLGLNTWDMLTKSVQFIIRARGHRNVTGTHPTTIEITTEDFLTPTGHCIIGITADHSLKDLPDAIKKRLKEGARVRIVLECGGVREEVRAKGGGRLSFSDQHALIIRKSQWQDGRTLAICADKASSDLNRNLIRELQKGRELFVTLDV